MKEGILYRICAMLYGAFLLAGGAGTPVQAQPLDAVGVIPTVAPDGSVYVYHTAAIPYGGGVRVYRQLPGGGRVWLTPDSLAAVPTAAALERALGPALTESIRAHLDVADPIRMLARLRADRLTATLLSFTHPTLADALGRRVADPDAPMGQTVTYGAEVVMAGAVEAEGQATVELARPVIPQPEAVTTEQDAQTLTMRWAYPTGQQRQDRVYAFRVVRRTDGGELPVTRTPLLRNDAEASYRVNLRVAEQGVQHYAIVPMHMTGQAGPAAEVEVLIRDDVPPSAPTNLVADAGAAEVALVWRVPPEPDVAGYHVYRQPSLAPEVEPTRLTERPLDAFDTFYADLAAPIGETVYYTVTAVDVSGNESTPSRTTEALVLDRIAPPSPVALQAEPVEGGIALTWQYPVRPRDYSHTSILRRAQGRAGRVWLTADSTGATRYIDTSTPDNTLRPGMIYQYALTSLDATGNSSDTAYVEVRYPDREPPPPPAYVTAERQASGAVLLHWGATGAGDVVRYRIERMDSLGQPPVQAVAEATTWTDPAVVVGRWYTYRVAAQDSLGNIGPGAETQIWVADATPPRRVQGVQAASDAEGVLIVWDPSPALDLDHYRVERADLINGQYTALGQVAAGARRLWRDSEGQAGQWYRVIALDTSTNESRPSEEVRAE